MATEFKPLEIKSIIDSPASNVWELFSSPGHLEKIHAFDKHNPVLKWQGEGSVDQLEYYSGIIHERTFTAWLPEVGYDIEVVERPSGKHTNSVKFRISPVDENRSELTITSTPAIPEAPSEEERQQDYESKTKPGVLMYFTSLEKGVEYYLTTGKPVHRNQFGALSPYSPAE